MSEEKMELSPEEKIKLAQEEAKKELMKKIARAGKEIEEILAREGLALDVDHVVRLTPKRRG